MKNSKIEWKVVPGWPMYRVSNMGHVQTRWGRGGKRRYATNTWREVKGDRAAGYHRVTFYDGDRRQRFLAHRLVLELFDGPCPDGMEACHRNGKRRDNRVGNLYWGTPAQNWEDRRRHGRVASTSGSKNAHAKLNEQDVLTIRSRLSRGITGASLAAEFCVSPATISMIRNGRIWRHI